MFCAVACSASTIYVCEAGDEKYLGAYEQGDNLDGVPSWSNANDLTFFRSKGFWYIGHLGPWPPETHFRCVDGENCGLEQDTPYLADDGNWSVNKRFAVGDVPKFSSEPCSPAEEL